MITLIQKILFHIILWILYFWYEYVSHLTSPSHHYLCPIALRQRWDTMFLAFVIRDKVQYYCLLWVLFNGWRAVKNQAWVITWVQRVAVTFQHFFLPFYLRIIILKTHNDDIVLIKSIVKQCLDCNQVKKAIQKDSLKHNCSQLFTKTITIFFQVLFAYKAETYSKPNQPSKMELFAKIVTGFTC